MKIRSRKRRIYTKSSDAGFQNPVVKAWNEIAPVGREFGSPDYERLARTDALADRASLPISSLKKS